jgi:hypothetical protein
VRLLPIVLLCLILGVRGQDTQVSYVKYYRNDRDFVADNPLRATARQGIDHLQVSFNARRQPILKYWISATGDTVRREALSYNEEGILAARYELDADRNVVRLIKYGAVEPWSVEFRKYALPANQHLTFTDQQSVFTLEPGGVVREILFRTVDEVPYGRITLEYDHLGFLREETWWQLPEERPLRRFVYDHDIWTGVQQIWEFGREGELVSHVALEMAPADELYREPPPRTGNILDEVDVIIKEIRTRRVVAPIPAVIPKMEWDRLELKSGELYLIEFITIDEHGIRFRMPDDEEVLTIPLSRVRSLTSRWGDRLYPQPE